MAQQAKTQLEIAVKATGVAGLSKLRNALGSVDKIAKQSAVNFKGIGKELQQKNKAMVRSVENVSKLKASYQELARSVEFGSKQFKVATERAKRLDKELAKMEGRKPPGGGMGRVAQAFGVVVGLGAARQALQTGIQREESERRLQFLAKEYGEVTELQLAAASASRKFGQSQTEANQALANIYARLRPIGASLEDITSVYNGFNTAARVSGANAQEAANAFTQLAQGLGSGALRGDEFNSIAEQVPGVLTAISKETGVAQGKLRDFAAEGGITSDVVLRALKRIEREGADQLSEALNGPAQKIKDFQNATEQVTVALTQTVIPQLSSAFSDLGELILNLEPAIQFIGGIIGQTLKDLNGLIDMATRGPEVAARRAIERGNLPTTANLLNPFEGAEKLFGKEELNQLRKQAQEFARYRNQSPNDVLISLMQDRLKALEGDSYISSVDLTKKDTKRLDEDDEDTKTVRERFQMSERVIELRSRARREENDKRRIALELESKILELEERGIEGTELRDRLDQASLQAKKEMLEVDARRAEALKKVLNNTAAGLREVHSIFQGGDIPDQPEQKNFFESMADEARNFAQSLGTIQEAAQKVAEVGLKGLGDAITELVVTGTMNFRQFAASLLGDLARIIMQQVVVATLMQAIFPGKGLGLGSITKGVNFANPLGFKPIQQQEFGVGLPKYAKGGITRGVSIAGEAGPEAVVPLPDGRSIPVTMQGEGTKVVVNVDASGTAAQGDTGRARQLGDAIGSAVRQELLKQKRPGGLLA